MRVLALEPYYGGSHRAFLDGWRRRSQHEWTVLTLPATKWKWRMRHGAVHMAWEVESRLAAGEHWDVIFCSDMLNLAEFRGLVPSALRSVPAVLYFHENQLTYPVRFERERDYQFGLTNILSSLAADEVWFNSGFHRRSFLTAIPTFLKRMPDHRPLAAVQRIVEKSQVYPPGVAMPPERPGPRRDGPMRLLWAARWEHDKAPELFFEAVEELHERGVDFRLSVLGERFKEWPAVFDRARERFAGIIDRWGTQPRAEYEAALLEADVFVSTAEHEFFGITAVEAIAAGAYPLLPSRLAYPELLEVGVVSGRDRHCYDGGAKELADGLEDVRRRLDNGVLWAPGENLRAAAERFAWEPTALKLDRGLEGL